jgi:hypothetical protein
MDCIHVQENNVSQKKKKIVLENDVFQAKKDIKLVKYDVKLL